MEAVACITKPENQGVNAELTGNMPASSAGYDYPALAKIYPQPTCSTLFQESLDAAAPRTVTPYWSDISGALQSTWHPPDSVNDQTTRSVADVHRGRPPGKEAAVSATTRPHRRCRAQAAVQKQRSDRARAENRLGLKLVAPAVVVMLLVTAYPMIQALYLSLFRYRLTDAGRQGVRRPRATTPRC